MPSSLLPIAEPVLLQNAYVRLEPLRHEHHDDLAQAVEEGQLHALWYTQVPSAAGMRAEMERRLGLLATGSMLPFAVVETSSGKAVGMTSYMHIDAVNRRVEIGSTWYAVRVQRTAMNTAAKLLLLQHAFNTLGCIAVEFRTHFLNQRSRRAIERLGARLDGVLRAHMRIGNGTLRDTCVYSITAPEWPAVEAHLQALLQLPR